MIVVPVYSSFLPMVLSISRDNVRGLLSTHCLPWNAICLEVCAFAGCQLTAELLQLPCFRPRTSISQVLHGHMIRMLGLPLNMPDILPKRNPSIFFQPKYGTLPHAPSYIHMNEYKI